MLRHSLLLVVVQLAQDAIRDRNRTTTTMMTTVEPKLGGPALFRAVPVRFHPYQGGRLPTHIHTITIQSAEENIFYGIQSVSGFGLDHITHAACGFALGECELERRSSEEDACISPTPSPLYYVLYGQPVRISFSLCDAAHVSLYSDAPETGPMRGPT